MARGIHQQNAQLQQGCGAVSSTVGNLRSALGTLGIAFGVSTVTSFVKSTFDAAGAIQAASDAAGIGAVALQQWREVAEQSGSSAAQMDQAIQVLNQRFGDFVRDGAGPAKAAFEELGLAARIQAGEFQGTEQVMDAVVSALTAIDDPARQASLAADLFGRTAGPELRGLLGQGIEGINDLRAATTVLSNEQVRQADEIADRWESMTRRIKTTLQSATLTVVDWGMEGAKNNQAATAAYERMGEDIIAAAQGTVEGVAAWFQDRLPEALGGVTESTRKATEDFERMEREVVGQSIVPPIWSAASRDGRSSSTVLLYTTRLLVR
jgi:hypothetical protein